MRVHSLPGIGAFEARARIRQLLQRVQEGERFVMTRHGRPAAELVVFQSRDSSIARTVIETIERSRQMHGLDGVPVRHLIQGSRNC